MRRIGRGRLKRGMKMIFSDTIRCPHCDLSVCRLYKVKNLKRPVCRFCKKDYETNGKLTRKKVVHNYLAAEEYISKRHREENPPRERWNRR